MERRVFIAIVLSFLVLYMYQAYFAPPPPNTAAKPVASGTAPAQQSAAAGSATPAATPPEASAVATTPSAPEPQVVVGEPSERAITVDTATVQAVFTNSGARLLHWRLKGYRDNSGQQVDLVPSDLPPVEQLPFSLRVDQSDLTVRLNTALYRVGGDANGHVDATRNAAALSFEFQDASGLRVRKEFTFDPSNYMVALSVDAASGDRAINPSVVWGPGLGDITPSASNPGFFNRSAPPPPEVILHRAGKVERLQMNTIAQQPVQESVFRFAGVDTHYFMMAVINPGQLRMEARPLVVNATPTVRRPLVSSAFKFAGGATNKKYFIGPKQFDLLRSIDPELPRAVYFGTFGWLAIPLLGALKWLHAIVGNWGWSIVLLTVLINLAMFPLRHKSVVSMRRMQELQPQLKAIQDRYANLKATDPAKQKMNTEVMNLYREKGVNPASGCIPMLLMMPVLLAFYAMLGYAIELRGAEFGWWIKDLSQPDPFFVIPILVGLTMFWQTWMNPTSTDPAQRNMMLVMPIMFSFIFLTTAAGTALYWLISNIWGIGQQYFTNWLIGPPVIRAARPAAERRLKKAQ